MVWYFHLLKNLPQFVVIHTVKGCSIVNEAEEDVFLELSSFFYDAENVGNLISDSLAFAKPRLDIFYLVVLNPGCGLPCLFQHHRKFCGLLVGINTKTNTGRGDIRGHLRLTCADD